MRRCGVLTAADFSGHAGIDPYDERAAASNLPPVDGLNMWPLISGQNSTSPRAELPVDESTLIQGSWKLKLGKDSPAGW